MSDDRDKPGEVAGERLLHLQCHIGTDTISWARLGAEVTGTDLSERSIEGARLLSEDSGPRLGSWCPSSTTPPASSTRSSTSSTPVWGDLSAPRHRGLGRGGCVLLEPGGTFYMQERHPMMWALDSDDSERLPVVYPYFEIAEPTVEIEEETYAGKGEVASPLNYGWNHGLGETINALIQAGLRIDRVEEHNDCEWQGLEQMVLDDDGLWRLSEGRERLPLMWSVPATKV